MIREAIKKLSERRSLSYEEARSAMNEIMTGAATPAQIAGYLTALAMKGESVEEIVASARSMRDNCVKNPIPADTFEIVGTGGDCSYSFNISTAAAFVLAGAGVPVAKHGNRSVSSKCGAADVLEALGANLKTSPEQAGCVFDKCNFVFLHAQVYHPAMRYAAPVRRELGIRTIFNILGPLANPAGAGTQLLGVYSRAAVRPLCEVLAGLGTKRVMSVYGADGLDEISVSDKTFCCEYADGSFREYAVSPADFGLPLHEKREIEGGEPQVNAEIMRRVMNGERGAYRDAVVANAAACLYMAGRADNLSDGARLAERIIDDGKAKETMEVYIAATNEV